MTDPVPCWRTPKMLICTYTYGRCTDILHSIYGYNWVPLLYLADSVCPPESRNGGTVTYHPWQRNETQRGGGCESSPTRKQYFRPETAKKRLHLTSYMSYTDVEGRGWP